MSEVRLERVTKRFGTTEILRDVNLTIYDGEFFTLVGPSGCGKSTLLHLIAGLENLTDGQIYFDDQPISHLSPKDRDVALVFQSYALYPHMTVYENLAFPLRMKKQPVTEIDRQIQKAAELLGLTSVLSHRPKALSGGQRQRVALGRAMVRQPRVFLLDEPLSNLDAQLRIEMRSELKKLHQSLKVTMIYVTHDQAEAMTLSDRMAVLHKGVIQQCGTPQEIYNQPTNLFVAGFMGNPPMNLLSGNLTVRAPRTSIPRDRIILGVRPEHIHPSRAKGREAITAQVFLVEPMGSEIWLEVVCDGSRLKVKASADFDVKAGETIYIKIDERKVQVFDNVTGSRIFCT